MADQPDPNALPPLPAAPAAAIPVAQNATTTPNKNKRYILAGLALAVAYLTYTAITGSMPNWAASAVGGVYEKMGLLFMSPAVQNDGSILAMSVGGMVVAVVALTAAITVYAMAKIKK